MEYIRHNTDFQLHNTAVALGKFDGIHKGHQLLLDEILSQQKKGCTGTVFTFDIPPSKLTGDSCDGVIMTGREREVYLKEMGIDVVVEYPFTYEFSRMEPEEFVKNILIGQMDMKLLAVGEDFRFGKDRSGDVRLLKKLSERYAFSLRVKKKLTKETDTISDSLIPARDDTNIISSTRIKCYIRAGALEAANTLLGHPYTISGTVISGSRLGRTIAYPTANVAVPLEKILPPFGVYAVRIVTEGMAHQGIANLGNKPTVQDTGDIGLETFIFDFQGDIYQKDIQVQLLKFIRRERRFDTVEALSRQIGQDVSEARKYLLE